MLSIRLFALMFTLATSGADWTYNNIKEWPKNYPDCKGNQQSPIALKYGMGPEVTTSQMKEKGITKTVLGHDEKVRGSLCNTGHLLEINSTETDKLKIPRVEIVMKEGNTTYYLINVDFHLESPHTINGERYPLEVMSGYMDENKNGLVLSTFYKYCNESVIALKKIEKSLDQVIEPYTCVALPPFKLHELWRTEETGADEPICDVFKYSGSYLRPPCTEPLVYILYYRPRCVTKAQIEKFNAVKNYLGYSNAGYRPVQPLNNRKVYCIKCD